MAPSTSSDALDAVPLLAHLPPQERARVVAAGHARHIARGEVLFHEGDAAEALFAVREGRCKLVRTSPAGKELLLHLVEAGQSFAEAALFGQVTYPATAVALERTRLWCLPRARLVELVEQSPDLALALLASLSQWTRRLATKLEHLTQRRVEERLATFLLGRAPAGELARGGRIPLEDPRHLIAAQIGTAPEVLSRTLKRLEELGVARFDARTAEILDPDGLRDLARGVA